MALAVHGLRTARAGTDRSRRYFTPVGWRPPTHLPVVGD